MSRKLLATWMLLESRKALVLGDVIPKSLIQIWKLWEVPVLLLLSLVLQVILIIFSNHRKHKRSSFLGGFLWFAYVASDSVATLALGVISSDLSDALKFNKTTPPRLEPRVELFAFWTPFLLLHLGGPDTITAFQLEDNELWHRHMLSLGVQTGLALYIICRAWTLSTLSTLSLVMLTAGSIKYGERTWSLWFASYVVRRQKAERALLRVYHSPAEKVTSMVHPYRGDLASEINRVVVATKMFRDTKGMFANALVKRNRELQLLVAEEGSTEVMHLIEMELRMVYDDLYTKAREILSYPGFALRFIGFILTFITLIMFSSSERRHRHFRSIPEYSFTIVLLVVSISLELYAAFLFLTSYRMVSWFRQKEMNGVARAMMKLARLRTPNWSNSMGQFSDIRYFLKEKPTQPSAKIFLTKNVFAGSVYYRSVPDELKEFIHDYLKKALGGGRYNKSRRFPFLESRGREPWYLYKDRLSQGTAVPSNCLEEASHIFEKEFGEIIIFLHLVTEVCYYMDRPVRTNKVPNENNYVLRICKVTKLLSRYLMHLFVLSSDLLPQQTPLSKKLYEDLSPSWQPFFTPLWYYEPKEEGLAGGVQGKKVDGHREMIRKVCFRFWERSDQFIGSTVAISALRVAHNLLRVMTPDHRCPSQVKERWELLSAVWVELLVFAAVQCKARAHAQHLRLGGELLTHVWVLLGHFGFLDKALFSLDNSIDRAQYKYLGLIPEDEGQYDPLDDHDIGRE